MCTYYHASNLPFFGGQPYSIDDFKGETTYDHSKRTEKEKTINIIMDEARPNGVLNRVRSIFLFGNKEHCFAYARMNEIKHIYAVRPTSAVYGPFPMTLLTTLYNCNEEDRDIITKEYWHPTRQWKVFEYLVSSFKVINEIKIENKGNNIADYVYDRELSNKKFNRK